MPDAAGTPPPPGDDLLFGNFQILQDAAGQPRLLGQGAFGRTYQARHRYVDTVVALKVVAERFARDPVVRERFLVEGRAAAQLSHPHIARLHDFGEKNGLLYYAMDYCAGEDLGHHVARHGPLSGERLMQVAREIGGALQCAHAAGLVHRDVKPANIMLAGPEFSTRLIDFGLVHPARRAGAAAPDEEEDDDPDDDNVNTSQAMARSRFAGTPLFASPEQLREEPVDGRSDLFSLGLTLWSLAVGALPEGGSLAQIAASRLNAEPYAARLPAGLPPGLRACLARLLEKDPAQRPADAAEFLAALSAAPEPRLAELEELSHALEIDWQLLSREVESASGVYYPAQSTTAVPERRWIHLLFPVVAGDDALLRRVRQRVARAGEFPAGGRLLRPLAMRWHPDYGAILLESPGPVDLLTALGARAGTGLKEVLPFLERLAQTADAVIAAGLPAPDLRAGSIFLRGNGATPLAEAEPLLLPTFLTAAEVGGAPEEGAPAQFARLIGGLFPAPGLPGAGGRLLAACVAREVQAESCGDLLHRFVAAEEAGRAGGDPAAVQSRPLSLGKLTARLAAALAVLAALAGGAILLKKKARARSGPPIVSTSTLAAGTTGRILAEGLPARAVFRCAGRALAVTRAGDDRLVDLGGLPRKFPLELTLEAPGFKPGAVVFSDERSLGAPQPAPPLYRTTGTMLFLGNVGDYTQATAEMVRLLPEEEGFDAVSVERGDRGVEIRVGGRNSLELATGVYRVSARDDRTRKRLFLDQEYAVKAGQTAPVTLAPPAGN